MRPLTLLRPVLAVSAAGLALVLGMSLGAAPAHAQDFRLHLEPAAAFWVDAPQSDRFTPGLYLALRPGIALGRVVELQGSYALLYTPAAEGFTGNGTAHFVTAGLRVRPFAMMSAPEEQLGGLFVDGHLGYVRSERFDRFGFDFGLGYAFQLSPTFSLGLVARYGHIVQPDHAAGQDPNDGQFVTVGLDLGFGPAYETEEERCPSCTACADKTCLEPARCPDGDDDGVCDIADRCPTQIGAPGNLGCPTLDPCRGPPLIVRVQFEYDSADLPLPRATEAQTMDPVLDAVAKAIAQDPSCRVCIVGYASEEGAADHNERLSQRRAAAVQGYMTARGLAQSRTPTTGFGERCQLVPERSLERNRRVEFRRLDDGQSCPTTCTP